MHDARAYPRSSRTQMKLSSPLPGQRASRSARSSCSRGPRSRETPKACSNFPQGHIPPVGDGAGRRGRRPSRKSTAPGAAIPIPPKERGSRNTFEYLPRRLEHRGQSISREDPSPAGGAPGSPPRHPSRPRDRRPGCRPDASRARSSSLVFRSISTGRRPSPGGHGADLGQDPLASNSLIEDVTVPQLRLVRCLRSTRVIGPSSRIGEGP